MIDIRPVVTANTLRQQINKIDDELQEVKLALYAYELTGQYNCLEDTVEELIDVMTASRTAIMLTNVNEVRMCQKVISKNEARGYFDDAVMRQGERFE